MSLYFVILHTVISQTYFFLSIPRNSKTIQPTIARFDPIEDSWAKLGELKVARLAHDVIQVDNEFTVIGGIAGAGGSPGGVPTESCKLNNNSMTCFMREPKLFNFAFYPALILTPCCRICKYYVYILCAENLKA